MIKDLRREAERRCRPAYSAGRSEQADVENNSARSRDMQDSLTFCCSAAL